MTTGEIHTPVTGDELAHTFEEQVPDVDLRVYAPEDWLTLALFWLMALAVFLQFFTRYVLNNSFAWTEEIATYCLVVIVFMGSVMCVRLGRHIHVDFLFPLPARRPGTGARDRDRPHPHPVLRLCGLARLALHEPDRGRDDDDDRPAEDHRLRRGLLGFVADVRALDPGRRSRTGGGAIPILERPEAFESRDLKDP